MTIELSVLLSGISVAFAVFFGIANEKREQKKFDTHEASDLATVIVKLENIGNDTQEIKNDLRGVKDDIKQHTEKIIRIDESCKQAHKRLDAIEARTAFLEKEVNTGKPNFQGYEKE